MFAVAPPMLPVPDLSLAAMGTHVEAVCVGFMVVRGDETKVRKTPESCPNPQHFFLYSPADNRLLRPRSSRKRPLGRPVFGDKR